jgi:hypothetical protein
MPHIITALYVLEEGGGGGGGAEEAYLGSHTKFQCGLFRYNYMCWVLCTPHRSGRECCTLQVHGDTRSSNQSKCKNSYGQGLTHLAGHKRKAADDEATQRMIRHQPMHKLRLNATVCTRRGQYCRTPTLLQPSNLDPAPLPSHMGSGDAYTRYLGQYHSHFQIYSLMRAHQLYSHVCKNNARQLRIHSLMCPAQPSTDLGFGSGPLSSLYQCNHRCLELCNCQHSGRQDYRLQSHRHKT